MKLTGQGAMKLIGGHMKLIGQGAMKSMEGL